MGIIYGYNARVSNTPTYKFRNVTGAPIQLRLRLEGPGIQVVEPNMVYTTTVYDDVRRLADDPRFEIIADPPKVDEATNVGTAPEASATVAADVKADTPRKNRGNN